MNVLITGGLGYIGSRLVERLSKISPELKLTIVDSGLYNNYSVGLWLGDRATVHCYDCQHKFCIQHLLPEADVVVHLAAIVGQPACDKRPYDAWATNAGATELLVNNLRDDQHLIFANTNSGYGIKKDGLCVEEDELHPISIYGTSKVAAENIVKKHQNHTIFRFATVFGKSPRMRYDLMVNEFIYEIANKGRIDVFNPNARRNFVHINDACHAIAQAIYGKLPIGTYNCGNDDLNMTKLEVAQTIFDAMDMPANITIIDGEDPDKRDYLVSNEKINNYMEFLFDIKDAVRELTPNLPDDLSHCKNTTYL